ncbi:MAG: cation transporter dimerization domain-containing protein, partial [Terriglobales bacterium]
SILTHIESEPAVIEPGDEMGRDAAMEERLRRVAAEFPEIVDTHEVIVKKIRERLHVSCHCTLSDDLPLSRVHEVITALELRFRAEAPQLFKILIHPEPATDNRR